MSTKTKTEYLIQRDYGTHRKQFLVKLTKAVDKAAEEIRKADEEQDKAKDACDGARL